MLLGAVVRVAELPDGYELALDLGRISDAQGQPDCVVEVAEWVDLESRCCPFLDFRIDVVEKGRAVRMRFDRPGERQGVSPDGDPDPGGRKS